MCGIAGYSFGNASRVNRTLAAQALLAGIAERGADAVVLPPATGQALIHVRDYTKGHPTIAANNHPVRHGRVTGIHNGIISNDEELFARHRIERDRPEMTVDSEVIFALVDAGGTSAPVLEELVGAMAAAWIDERSPDVLHVARGVGRPLWLARGRHEVLFASTRAALEVVEQALGTTFRKTEVEEGRLLTLVGGSLVGERRWSPDRSYREDVALPSVRAPHEGRFCLERLAALIAPA